MCLLITGTSSALRTAYLTTKGLAADAYASNRDGIGAMYASNDGRIVVSKVLPSTVDEALAFIESLPTDDRQVALHWRMRTHGDIDLSQCHPYEVNDQAGGTWLMHNGVLHTGNQADQTKSDTWHFINDYLKGLSPDALHEPGAAALIGEFIKGNRFAIMSGDGRLTVINKHQGVEHDGIWFSNTYAWSPHLFIPSYARPFRGYSSEYSSGFYGSWFKDSFAFDGDDAPLTASTHSSRFLTAQEEQEEQEEELQAQADMEMILEEIADCLFDYDVSTLTQFLRDAPETTVRCVVDFFVLSRYEKAGAYKLSELECTVRDAWLNYDEAELLKHLKHGRCRTVAEALLYYCDYEVCDVSFRQEEV